jgi:hypothetical protein
MIKRQAVWATAAWMTAIATLAAADPIRVTALVVDPGRVFASFAAQGALDEDAEAVMRSGLLLTFTYTVELRRPVSLWFDATLGRVAVSAAVKHDTLTGAFQVSKTRGDKVTWSDRTEQEAQVRSWMTEFEKIPIDFLEELAPNGEYYISVRLHKNPRPRLSIWPFGGGGATGRADFTYIR